MKAYQKTFWKWLASRQGQRTLRAMDEYSAIRCELATHQKGECEWGVPPT